MKKTQCRLFGFHFAPCYSRCFLLLPFCPLFIYNSPFSRSPSSCEPERLLGLSLSLARALFQFPGIIYYYANRDIPCSTRTERSLIKSGAGPIIHSKLLTFKRTNFCEAKRTLFIHFWIEIVQEHNWLRAQGSHGPTTGAKILRRKRRNPIFIDTMCVCMHPLHCTPLGSVWRLEVLLLRFTLYVYAYWSFR